MGHAEGTGNVVAEIGFVPDQQERGEIGEESGEFGIGDFGAHAAGEPWLDEGSFESGGVIEEFFVHVLGCLQCANDRAGEDEIGEEIVLTEPVGDAVALGKAFGGKAAVVIGGDGRFCLGMAQQKEHGMEEVRGRKRRGEVGRKRISRAAY